MTVFQISIEVNSGSVGRIAEQIGEKLIEIGATSYITFARNNLPSRSQTIRIGNKFDLYNHVIQTRLIDNHCFASTRATKKLISQIEKINPDIIHLHHLHGYFINIEVLFDFLKLINKPVVWTFHDCWSFTGHCAYFEYVECEKWKTGCYSCPQLSEYPKTLFLDRTNINYQTKKAIFNGMTNMTIVPVSEWLGRLVGQSFLKDYPIKVIQNGIDINIFYPKADLKEVKERFDIKGTFTILGVASTWEKRKGLEFFVKLNDMLPEDWNIVLVGISKQQLRNLPKSITGILRTENVHDLASLYSLADVFINPTLEDTFPTTNLEALACGTPVVTFDTGGSVESVDSKTGFVVPKENVAAIFEKIITIHKAGKKAYGINCRQRATTLYDKNKKFTEYIELYQRLLDLKD